MDEQLPCTGERLVPQLQGDIAYEHLHRYALALQLCAGRVVLDIACGEGYGAHLMAQTAKEVIGVDLAPDVVKHASTTYRRNNLSFRVGDCCRLPVASSSLDLVVCFETLEHHDRHEEMLAEFKRVLKPDGILLVSTPEKSNYTDGTGHSNPFHVRELYRADFEALLRSHFAQTATFGQRMVRGSLVAPISGAISAAFATLTGNFSGITSEPGLSRPMYLLGLATDRGELPDPSMGIFEGNGLLEDFQLRAVSKEQEARVAAGEVSNRDAVIAKLQASLQAHEAAAEQAGHELARRDAQRRELQSRLDERSAEVSVLRARLEQEERLHALTDQVRAALAVPYRQMIRQLRGVVRDVIPAGATVAVVSRGDEELLRLDGRPAWHFPRSADGCYAGAYPADSDGAIGHLESLRLQGAEYLVFPDTAMWWLDHYREFAGYLQCRYRVGARVDGVCHIFALCESPAQQGGRPAAAGQTRSGSGAGGARQTEYRRLVECVRQVVADLVPHDATVAVVSRGDPQLLDLGGRKAWHFPLAANGEYAGHYPADSGAAIAHLESLIAKGADHLLLPGTAFWWLDYYGGLSQYLDRSHHRVADLESCVIFRLCAVPQRVAPEYTDARTWTPPPLPSTDGELGGEAAEADGDVKDEGYDLHPLFDAEWYLKQYPDVRQLGVDPLEHYLQTGTKEGRAGNPDDLRVVPFEANYRIPTEPMTNAPEATPRARAIAFYLPQFHPIPENDKWWGAGFTEWANVRRATPQFDGHYQPHVPTGLGYYDLRDERVLEAQAELASQHGIYGFCFYFYWFNKKVLLDLPVRRILATGRPDFPFCICWANENWTRRWDGLEKEVLIAQDHSPEDDLEFIRHVEPILLHKNYIRIDGKPLLLVYRPHLLPDAGATAARWRDYFRARGHGELYLAVTPSFHDRRSPTAYGFDAGVQFPPHAKLTPVTHLVTNKAPTFEGNIYDYGITKAVFLEELLRAKKSDILYPCVMPSWDNSARRLTKAHIWVNASPESYHDWLSQAVDYLHDHRPPERRLVFVNAWNEWAEGCHLEPDTNHGHAWLNATRLALYPEPLNASDAPAQSHLQPAKPSVESPIPMGWGNGTPRSQATRIDLPPDLPVYPEHYNLRLLPATRTARNPATLAALKGRVAVHLHAYFTDKFHHLLNSLQTIPVNFDLFVSTDSEAKARQIAASLSTLTWMYSSVQIEVCPNRGRDIAPFMVTFGKRLLNYSYALHIHTKKCEYDVAHGASWLNHNLEHLLYNDEYVYSLLELFERDCRQGVLLPIPYPGIASWMDWGSNRAIACGLLARLGITKECLNSMPLYFPAGSMFWFRPSALCMLLGSGITYEDFPPEPIPTDGTLAHAIERCFLYIANYNGYSYTTISHSGGCRLPKRRTVAAPAGQR